MTGHRLLERYGMTEIGMALGNPLHGRRRAGTVGVPFPDVALRLVDEVGQVVPDGAVGELEVQSAQVFQEYWQRPEETAKAFRDGWFLTGDVAIREDGYCSADAASISSNQPATNSRRWRSRRPFASTPTWPTARWSGWRTRTWEKRWLH